LPMIRHRCKIWALAQSLGDLHRSLVTLERVLSDYNEDLIFVFPHQLHAFCLRFLVNFSHTRVIGLIYFLVYYVFFIVLFFVISLNKFDLSLSPIYVENVPFSVTMVNCLSWPIELSLAFQVLVSKS